MNVGMGRRVCVRVLYVNNSIVRYCLGVSLAKLNLLIYLEEP